MTHEEAENLLAQAVALNIVAETCSLYRCCNPCPFYYAKFNKCIFDCNEKEKFNHVKEMERQSLSILNKGEKNNDK